MTYGLLALIGVYLLSRRHFTIWRSDAKKYMTRYYVIGQWFRTIFNCRPYLHHFHASDDDEFHSHRWKWSYGLILWGGYEENRLEPKYLYSELGKKDKRVLVPRRRVFKPLSVNKLDSECFHRVDLLDEKRGCWTLFLAGPHDAAKPDWGFLRSDGSVEYAKDRFGNNRDHLSND
jgi:hypothetical protein